MRRENDKDGKWKLLGETWQLAGDAVKSNRCGSDAVSELLPAAKYPSS